MYPTGQDAVEGACGKLALRELFKRKTSLAKSDRCFW